MPFPSADKVRYLRSPLDSVTCQASFSPILRIEAAPPVEFQERVNEVFPSYKVKEPGEPLAGLPNFPHVRVEDPGGNDRSYLFESSEPRMSLRLAKSMLSLSAFTADAWETVRSRFASPLVALVDTYRIKTFTHICIRHRYTVRRSHYNLGTVSWSELLRPWVFGPLGDRAISSDFDQAQCKYAFKMPVGRMDVSFGLTIELPRNETVLLFESHTFDNTPMRHEDVIHALDSLTDEQRLFFRHCFTERLHGCFSPMSVSAQGQSSAPFG